jgi:hypothetical protein
MNSLRAETNAANNSINGDRMKKLGEEVEDVSQRINDN